jgi:histidinol-phosphate aminotransferase
MYQVAAGIHNTEVSRVMLSSDYLLDASYLLKAITPATRVIFLCSPNNPTGNALDQAEMEKVLKGFPGPVVIDEAYIDFSPEFSFLPRLNEFSNLIVLQTFSKAWGMAGIRLGMAFASPAVIAILNKIKYPYNLNILTQQKALELLENLEEKDVWVRNLLQERKKLETELMKFSFVEKVFPSDANFLLVRIKEARKVYEWLTSEGIIVRDRSRILLCEETLRITVGTAGENDILLRALKNYGISR